MLMAVGGDGMMEVTAEPSIAPLVPPPTSLHRAARGILDDSSVRPMITIVMTGASPRRAPALAPWPVAARRVVRRRAFRRRVLIRLLIVLLLPMAAATEARAAPVILPPSSTVVLPPSWRAGSLASITCGRSEMKLRGDAVTACSNSPRPGSAAAVESPRAGRAGLLQCHGAKPRRGDVRRGIVGLTTDPVDRRVRSGEGGETGQTGDTRSSAPRLAVRVIAMTVTTVETLGTARDASAVPLLLLLISSTQRIITAASNAGHFVGTRARRAAASADGQGMMMTKRATRRACGSGQRRPAAGGDDDDTQEDEEPVAHAASAGDVPDAASSGLAIRTAARVGILVGLRGAPGATGRRCRPPPPTPRGVLAEGVYLPARTFGSAVSAPPPPRWPRAADGTRVEERQPRPTGRLAALL